MELISASVFVFDVIIIVVTMSVLAWREAKWRGSALRWALTPLKAKPASKRAGR